MDRRQRLVVGNWKMNGGAEQLDELGLIDRVVSTLDGVRVAICPPATLIQEVEARVQTLEVGGQDCHQCASGAYTGAISAGMLRDAGASFVLVGHSERRSAGDSNEDVRRKAEAVTAAGLSVIVCVGEHEADRASGRSKEVVATMLIASLPDVGANNIAVAYEPVWAIGSGRMPASEEIAEVHDGIRAELLIRYGAQGGGSIPILYGGSVTAATASGIMDVHQVDGLLVGGASLSANAFISIVRATGAAVRSVA